MRSVATRQGGRRAASPPSNIIDVIADAARDPDVDPAKMLALWDLHERAEKNIDRREFNAAMSRVQGAISQVATDAANPSTSSKYASYAALDAALRPYYTAEGFSVSYDSEVIEGGLMVTCIVSRGSWETRHHAPIPVSTQGAKGGQVMTATHAAGSGLSYGKRYSLAMAFSVAVARDDDGNRAGQHLISPSELGELLALADECSVDLPAFCTWLGVDTLNDIPRNQLNKVKTYMRAKREKKHV
jgi:hypothetical protein